MNKSKQYDYKKMIVEMLNKIESNRKLKRIFDYTCFVYYKSKVWIGEDMKSKEKYIQEINEYIQDLNTRALPSVLALVKALYR